MERAQELWNKILDNLSTTLDSDIIDDTFTDTKVVNENNNVISILVPTLFIQNKINTYYTQYINKIATNINNGPVRFKFITREDIQSYSPEKPVTITPAMFESNLSNTYTFDSFIVGDSNRFAHRQALLVADQPGAQANPLYIFGGVGIGKTHLMHAIGNYILDKNINTKVLYIKTQDYITDFQKAAQSKDFTKFDDKYKDIDILLVDDIQMLGTAKKTQEKFFELFNTLYDNKKQIVMTSDKPANQLPEIMPRLTSRFAWGMQVDINTPDLPLKIKILNGKLYETSSNDVNISDDILEYISSLYENIRDLEGCLRRVLAYATTDNSNIDMDLVKEALNGIIQTKNNDINNIKYDNLKSVIADFYNISVDDLISKKRQSSFVTPRHICMYILKNKYNLTNKEVADLMGKKDHSTVISACGKIEEDLKTNKDIKIAYDLILKKID